MAITGSGGSMTGVKKDNSIRVWDLTTFKELKRLNGHEQEVLQVALSPDGKRALSASWDGTVRLWSTVTGQELQRHELDRPKCVAFSADGGLAIAGGNKTITIWDTETDEELHRLAAHEGLVRCLAVSPDGRQALSAGDDGTIRVWTLPPPGPLPSDRPSDPAASGTPTPSPATSNRPLSVLGLWEHKTGTAPPIRLRFLPNGHVNQPADPVTWSLRGSTLTLRWPNKTAPGGVWIDTCTVTLDGRSYSGRNQANAVIRGVKVGD